MNLAASFSVKNCKVIGLDLDLRRASLSHYVNSPLQGVSDYLNGSIDNWRQIVVPVEGFDKLQVLPVGSIPSNPSELLASPRLQQLIDKLRPEYDLVFIDADKQEYCAYLDLVYLLVRKGGFILADNTLWDGHVVDPAYDKEKQTLGLRAFNEQVAQDERLEQVILPLRDGLTLIRKI